MVPEVLVRGWTPPVESVRMWMYVKLRKVVPTDCTNLIFRGTHDEKTRRSCGAHSVWLTTSKAAGVREYMITGHAGTTTHRRNRYRQSTLYLEKPP